LLKADHVIDQVGHPDHGPVPTHADTPVPGASQTHPHGREDMLNSKAGAAWMDKETQESFARILADATKAPTTRTDWVPGKLDEIRDDLTKVEPRGNYFGAWLNDRANWSVWRELEMAQRLPHK